MLNKVEHLAILEPLISLRGWWKPVLDRVSLYYFLTQRWIIYLFLFSFIILHYPTLTVSFVILTQPRLADFFSCLILRKNLSLAVFHFHYGRSSIIMYGTLPKNTLKENID